MKYFKILVLGGLSISLLSNYIMFSKLDSMDNKINSVFNNQSQVISIVNSQAGNINNAINKIKEEQSWLSVINLETEVDETARNKANLSFEWQVKELENNSDVLFNYSYGEDKKYTSMKPEAKGNGFFRVVVPVQVKFEPNWNSRIVGNNISEREMRVIEEKEKTERLNRRFDYYVSISNGEITKSGEINTTHLEDIATRYYGYLEIYTSINENNFQVSLTHGKAFSTSVQLKEVYLKKYKDGQLVEEEELAKENIVYENGEPAREATTVFHTKPSQEKMDYSSLVLKVVYSDGSIFEREILI